MRIVQPDTGRRRRVDEFGSVGACLQGTVLFEGPGALTFITLAAGGLLGRHPAVLTQIYWVVEGSGWVSGRDGAPVAIAAGQAAVWDAGEEHESGTDTGMTVAILEVTSVHAD
jgi:quercetin dioxygenase-like cupin family protein